MFTFGNGRHRRPRTSQTKRLVATAGVAGAGIAIPLLGATSASAAPVSTWDRVAQCESSGDWSINTGNGFSGGLQFSQSTWDAYGGQHYASSANLATKDQQIAVAEKVLASQGPQAWPTCGPRAGLTRGGAAPQISTSGSGHASSATSASVSSVPHQHSRSADTTHTSSATPTRVGGSGETYTVRPGDWLSKIANTHHVAGGWQALYQLNKATLTQGPDLIYAGEHLVLGGHAAAPATPAAAPAAQAAPAPAVVQAAATSYGNNLDGWIAEAQAILAAHGDHVPPAAAIKARAMTESSGNPLAENHWDSNQARYGGTYGLMQFIRPTFAQWALPGHTNIMNPVDSIIASVRYANHQYGAFENIAYTKSGY